MKNDNFIGNLNIINGIIVYNDFDINENIPFEQQKYSFKEDILQIKYGDRFLLDVGWYPEFNPNGFFLVCAIKDYDWHNPLSKIKCKTLDELKDTIEKTAKLIVSQKDY